MRGKRSEHSAFPQRTDREKQASLTRVFLTKMSESVICTSVFLPILFASCAGQHLTQYP